MVAAAIDVCSEMREQNLDLWRKIDDHPFLTEMRDGTLPDRKLKFYFVQNVHYIDALVQFLAIAGAKAPDEDSRDFCLDLMQVANREVKRQRGSRISYSFSAQIPGEF